MNKLIFGDGFHVTPTVMTQLQSDAREGFDNIVGGLTNCILFGCEQSGTTISSGAVVINGELCKFEGGTYAENIKEVTTERTNIYKNNETKNAGYTKVYKCASDGDIALSSLVRYRIQYKRTATDWVNATIPTGATTYTDYPARYRINEQGKLVVKGFVKDLDNVPIDTKGKLICTIDVSGMNITFSKLNILAHVEGYNANSMVILTMYSDGTIYQDEDSDLNWYASTIQFISIVELD